MPSIPRWPIWEVDKLIVSTLKDDSTIKQLQKIASGGIARISGYRPLPVTDSSIFPYIFFYSIPGVYGRVNGNKIVQFNPDYDIEVRSLGAPTSDSVAIVERIDELIGTMKAQLTEDSKWVVSAVAKSEINITEGGETNDIYFTRHGNSYKFAVVRA